MLNQILDLLRTNDIANIELVWQILQGSEDVRLDFNEWLKPQMIRISHSHIDILKNEYDFVKICSIIKLDKCNKIVFNTMFCYLVRTTVSVWGTEDDYLQNHPLKATF